MCVAGQASSPMSRNIARTITSSTHIANWHSIPSSVTLSKSSRGNSRGFAGRMVIWDLEFVISGLGLEPKVGIQTFISRALPLYPRSSATSIAHFSPIRRAVESFIYQLPYPGLIAGDSQVLHPTLSGQIERSATLRCLTP
jgi:hypothetical protein